MNGQSQQSPVQEQPVSDGQEMQIKVISPSAVFVAHGMGQHLKFETLDQIAVGLLKADSVVRSHTKETTPDQGVITPDPEVITIDSREGYLHGVKLRLKGKNEEHEVHIFECYWAPLTEGEVNLREVMTFLVNAGRNGLANARYNFTRFLFNQPVSFPAYFHTTIYLLTAILVIAALAIMNTGIVTVAALSSPLTNSPVWLKGLRPDLTTLFNLYLIVAGAFGLIIYRSYTQVTKGFNAGDEVRRLVSIALLLVTIATTIACGLAILLLFYGHIQYAAVYGKPHTEYLSAVLVSVVNWGFSLILLLTVVVFLRRAWRRVRAFLKSRPSAPLGEITARSSKQPLEPLLWWGALAMLVIILLLDIPLIVAMLPDLFGDRSAFTAFSSNPWMALQKVCKKLSVLSWPLLIAVSWYVRGLLVQYIGDVAIYVTSHKLDRFNSLREKIRETVYTAAAAVYEAPAKSGTGFAYDNIFIVGHSLGAVVVYDALNRLINEDELGGRKLNVAGCTERTYTGRTKLLLTFGSPQDKIVFLFAQQKEGTGPFIREQLVAAAQPLVRSAEFRQFEWINIHSNLDVISGPLDFFDSPAQGGTGGRSGDGGKAGEGLKPIRVDNQVDKEARTLLAAHVEYWGNSLLYRILHEQITNTSPDRPLC